MAKKAVVIGSGPGGSACAALLAKKGVDVTLLEQHEFPGGRCAKGGERDGFNYDFGGHLFARGEKGPHGEVNRRIGGDLEWTGVDELHLNGKIDTEISLKNPVSLLKGLKKAREVGIGISDVLDMLKMSFTLADQGKYQEYDYVSLKDFLSEYTENEYIHVPLISLQAGLFGVPYSETSAGEFIYSFSTALETRSMGYPIGGVEEIPASFIRGMKKHGGEVHYGEKAVSIETNGNGKVKEVETENESYPADAVISNGGIRQTISLAGKENFPTEYVERADSLKYSCAGLTIKYALEEEVVPSFGMHCPEQPPEKTFQYIEEGTVPEDPIMMIFVPSKRDPSLAPEGKQLVIALGGTSNTPDEKRDQKILDKMHSKMCELYPDLEDNLLWKLQIPTKAVAEISGHEPGEGPGTGPADAVGLAQSVDQVGDRRPSPDMPLEGLYLVGADAGGRGVATEMASESGINVSEMVSNHLKNL